MKTTFIFLLLFIGLWLLLGAYLTTALPIAEYLPKAITNLTLPKTTTELGDSLAILDGIFSSLAIVLALVAIIFQSKELKESTKAQTEQARALSSQLNQQNEANKLTAYTARLQFLLGEMDRLGLDIDRLFQELDGMFESDKKRKKQEILDNTIEKRRRYRDEAENINVLLSNQLSKLT